MGISLAEIDGPTRGRWKGETAEFVEIIA